MKAYRLLPWALIGSTPLIVAAFWRGYFADPAGAPAGFHLHVATAAAWVLLLGAQSWAIGARRIVWHRAAGMALFAAAPLFIAAGALMLHSMSAKFAAGDAFYAVNGARLGAVDLLATLPAFALFVAAGVRQRRSAPLHAGWMAGTVLLMLPPALARLFAPPLGAVGLDDPFAAFAVAFHLGQWAPVPLALWLWRRAGRHGAPWLAVAVACIAGSVLFETLGRLPGWQALYAALSTVSAATLAAAAGAASLMLLLRAWRTPPRSRVAAL